MKVKEESANVGLKLNSFPLRKLRSWYPVLSLYGKYMEEKVETVTNFIFLCSKITADGDCSHEIKRCLLLRRKVMTTYTAY